MDRYPTTLADTLGQWLDLGVRRQQLQALHEENDRSRQLRQLYRTADPDPEAIARLDPEQGMKVAAYQARLRGQQLSTLSKQHALAQGVARDIVGKMQPYRHLQGAAFQQQLEAVGAPYKPLLAQVFNRTGDNSPLDWDSLNTLATVNLGGAKNIYSPVHSDQGTFLLNGVNGEIRPLPANE